MTWGQTRGLNWLWLGLILGLAGCDKPPASEMNLVTGSGANSKEAMISPGRSLVLPMPAEFGRSVEAAQLLTARYDSQSYSFEGRLSITPERLVLVGLDGMGRRAMTVTWNGHDMVIDRAPWLPEAVRPGSMLADIVVLYWPEHAVRKALAPAGCTLLATPKTRKVRCGAGDVLRAKYDWPVEGKWSGSLQYSNLAWGYEIDVQSQEVAQ